MIKLSNGKTVANFSSPHEFMFTDGSVLPAVSEKDADDLKVDFIEDCDEDGDLVLSFKLSEDIYEKMIEYMMLYRTGFLDIVYCPLPMILRLKEEGVPYRHPGKEIVSWSDLKHSPFRSVRIEDRFKKLVSIDKQCM